MVKYDDTRKDKSHARIMTKRDGCVVALPGDEIPSRNFRRFDLNLLTFLYPESCWAPLNETRKVPLVGSEKNLPAKSVGSKVNEKRLIYRK